MCAAVIECLNAYPIVNQSITLLMNAHQRRKKKRNDIELNLKINYLKIITDLSYDQFSP